MPIVSEDKIGNEPNIVRQTNIPLVDEQNKPASVTAVDANVDPGNDAEYTTFAATPIPDVYETDTGRLLASCDPREVSITVGVVELVPIAIYCIATPSVVKSASHLSTTPVDKVVDANKVVVNDAGVAGKVPAVVTVYK